MKKPNFHFIAGSIIFIIVATFFFPIDDMVQKSELPIVGQSVTHSIIAPISFDVLKNQQEMQEEMKRARDKVQPIFEYNKEITKQLSDSFEQLMLQIEKYDELQKEISRSATTDKDIALAGDLYQSLVRKISSTALKQLVQNAFSRDTLKNIFNIMLARGISNTLVVEQDSDVAKFEELHNTNNVDYIVYPRNEILLIKDGKETIVGSSYIRTKEVLIEDVLEKHKNIFNSNPGISSAFYEVLYVFVAPNLFYLENETERRKTEATLQINPSKGRVPRGMEIVSQGSIVTKDALEKLTAMQIAMQKNSSHFFNTVHYGQYMLFFIIVLMFCFGLWFFNFSRKVRPSHIWAIVVIALIQVILFRLVHDFFTIYVRNENLNANWFFPFVFAPVLASVLFSLRVSFVLNIWSSVLLGIFAGYDLSMGISAFLISFVMILIVNKIRYRIKFIQALGAGIVVFALMLSGILLLRNNFTLSNYLQNLLLGSSNLLICITFISVFCNAFEKVFSITTNLRLAELSDFNHPLLKRLSEYTSGTFYHSLQVANLGEIAGERIRANALLIRVMALYHDIGKAMRPEYFTENQKRVGYNPHDNLSPYDSMKVLRAHVERGIEFAEERNLPEPIITGIREHHGTSVAYFFYSKAKEMYPDKNVKYEDFCYNGSIPQSKETAILMLADAIEAISRSMQNAKTEDLYNMIQKTIEDKMFDNQLDDSGLTMRDLKELSYAFLQGIEGSIHSRIQYPANVFRKGRKKNKAIEE